jgi:hypothetical protein
MCTALISKQHTAEPIVSDTNQRINDEETVDE